MRKRTAQKPCPGNRSVHNSRPAIAVSVTNERGESYRYQARIVSLRIKRGVVQVVERENDCYLWFERCNLEVRDGRRNVLFRLLAGSASSDGRGLTIVAEVAPPSVRRTPRAKTRARRRKSDPDTLAPPSAAT